MDACGYRLNGDIDCWKKVKSISEKELEQPVRSAVAANGEELDIVGQCEVTMPIGNFSCCYPVLALG